MTNELKYIAVSDIGCVRANNEDMACADGYVVRDDKRAGTCVLDRARGFAVADGMGGYEGGEIASEIVSRAFISFLKDFAPTTDEKALAGVKTWAVETNSLVLETASLRPELAEMGTTFVGLIFTGSYHILINVGDSRCYRMRRGILKQMTVDHSERERTGNPDIPSNLIYNYMGNAECDFISDVTLLKVIAGDIYLLCSDGLSDLVDSDTIEQLMPDAESLIAAARQAGGRDNITAVVVHC